MMAKETESFMQSNSNLANRFKYEMKQEKLFMMELIQEEQEEIMQAT